MIILQLWTPERPNMTTKIFLMVMVLHLEYVILELKPEDLILLILIGVCTTLMDLVTNK